MNAEKLFELIGEADDAMITDAAAVSPRRRRFSPARAAAAAGLVLLLAAGGVTLHHLHTHRIQIIPAFSDVTQDLPAMTTSPMVLPGVPAEEIHQYAANHSESIASGDSASSTAAEYSGDLPSAPGTHYEAVDGDSLTIPAQDIFCGSYLDEQGRYVIVLTRDTPENRALICRELALSENDVLFKTGTYTLTYLTELQRMISEAMMNRSMPFVVTSGIYETKNRIVVGVTTRDETLLSELYALDALGGAIEVEYTESAAIQPLLEIRDISVMN